MNWHILPDSCRRSNEWVFQADRDDAIRVISGGPGSGKSSFTKIFAAKQAQNPHVRVFHVPLHLIDPGKDLVAAIQDFTHNHPYISFNPLEFPNGVNRLLLILDGLDELSMQGKVGATVAKELIDEVRQQVNRLNHVKLCLQVLLSGRELVVQANSADLRKPGQVLHLLPYFVPEDEHRKYIDPEHTLINDQRHTWWQKYGAVTGLGYQQLPDALNHGKLSELTAQPLLNYLVAISYEQGSLIVDETTNLNSIYWNLLTEVYRRGWERHPHPALQGMEQQDFVRILEEISIAIWHGDGRTSTVTTIQARCATNPRLQKQLEAFQEGAKSGVMRLLTAFYFRQSGLREGEPTFEFTHKSFGEYLAARRIVRAIGLMHDQLEQHQQDSDRGWSPKDALKHWAEICGPTAMDRYLFDFVCDEVRLLHQKGVDLATWQKTLSRLIEYMLKHGMPMEMLRLPTFYEENRQARNAEADLLAALNACARCTQTLSDIRWETPEAFGTWFARLQGQRKYEQSDTLIHLCLGWLNLSQCDLSYRDFSGTSLDGASLDAAILHRASLVGAHLNGASLVGASLETAILDQASLVGAHLNGASLVGAHLNGARLDGASLNRADLDGASLVGAHLNGARLDGASLDRASLIKASLVGAYLNGARLVKASLVGAHLNGARLDGAILYRARLDGAILHGASLDGASLDGASLDGATGLQPEQIRAARVWETAHYAPEFRLALGLPADEDDRSATSPHQMPSDASPS
jgi:uncharacterized protein YjbI with pentapeptide repeats